MNRLRTTRPVDRRDRTARIWWGVVATVATVALVLQFGSTLGGVVAATGWAAAIPVIRYLSYFTMLSNILVAWVAVSLVRDPQRDGRRWRVLHLNALVDITVTGLVNGFVFGNGGLGGLGALANLLLHYVSPAVMVIGWLVLGPRPRFDRRSAARASLVPVSWAAWTLLHGAVSGWYPYAVLDVGVRGYAASLISLAEMLGLAAVLLVAVGIADRRLPATAPLPAVEVVPTIGR
jgi:hypothetical protein